ncbi:MAG: hypothetical protein B7X93_05760 [Hydrogenophilales bacterium 17-61-9]|nr:MAG: hypothetical protein B7X93_05760 [Hydrogenophilales bacterium 17-61-9]
MPNTYTPTMFVTQASPTRRHIYITQSSSRQRAMASPATEESPLIAACRKYAQQYGGLGKRADADTAADTPAQGDGADDQESPLVRAARKRAEEARKHEKAQQR